MTNDERLKKLHDRQLQDICAVLASEHGRRFIWDLLTLGNMYQSTFSSDPLIMAFSEGQRAMALTVFARVMQANPEAYLIMQREAGEDELNANNQV